MINNKINNQGIVSIITVIFLALILSLITVGFMTSMTKNLKQSLDSQLNTQAFYAAESGINDVTPHLSDIAQNPAYQGLNNKCRGSGSIIDDVLVAHAGVSNVLASNPTISYSCLLVKPEVPNITTSSGGFYKLEPTTGVIDTLDIEWGESNQSSFRSDTNFPEKTSWLGTNPPVLRVTLYYPYGSGAIPDFSRNNLIAKQKTYFLIPGTLGGNTIGYSDGAKSKPACSTTSSTWPLCKATLNLTNVIESDPYDIPSIKNSLYIKISTIYNTSTIKVSAFDWATGSATPLSLSNAQYIIDATGKANDVYKRIQVRKNLNINEYPEYAVMSDHICKQFETYPTSAVGMGYEDKSGPPPCSD